MPQGSDAAEDQAWTRVFLVFTDPATYTTLLYLALSLPFGIFAFTWVITGLSLSVGLLVILLGFPLLVLMLGSIRALGLVEHRLAQLLLGLPLPPVPAILPQGGRWTERLGNLFRDSYTWTSLGYLLLRLPMGVLHFTALITCFTVSVAFMAIPFLRLPGAWEGDLLICGQPYSAADLPPAWLLLGLGFLGFLGLVGSMHLTRAFGRMQGWLVRQLLAQR